MLIHERKIPANNRTIAAELFMWCQINHRHCWTADGHTLLSDFSIDAYGREFTEKRKAAVLSELHGAFHHDLLLALTDLGPAYAQAYDNYVAI